MIMDKPRSKQPADAGRARRRSLVALTAEVSRAVDKGLATPPGPVTVVPQVALQIAQAAPASTTEPAQEAAGVIATTTEPPGSTTADLILDMAKDYQARALEGMKAGAHAALDYANDLARSLGGGAPEVEGVAAADSHLIKAIGTAAECRAVVLELVKVNAGATLEYARELGHATTFAEFVELSSTHARKQCELVLKQTELLKSLAQNIAKPGAR
jgi:phasin protein